MYIDNENFEKWMEKLSKKLTEIGQDLKSLINTYTVFDENAPSDGKRIIEPAISGLLSVNMPILKPTNSLKKPISWLISPDSKK